MGLHVEVAYFKVCRHNRGRKKYAIPAQQNRMRIVKSQFTAPSHQARIICVYHILGNRQTLPPGYASLFIARACGPT